MKFYFSFSVKGFSNVHVYVGHTLRSLELCSLYEGPVVAVTYVTIVCSIPIEGTVIKILTQKESVIPLSVLTICGIAIYGNNVSGIYYVFYCITMHRFDNFIA